LDLISGLNVLYYSRQAILIAGGQDRELFNNKKYMELFIGVIVSKMILDVDKKDTLVGFPLKGTNKNLTKGQAITIPMLLKNEKFIADTDIDICIGDLAKTDLMKCQITRVTVYDQEDVKDKFKKIFEKKLLTQVDKSLCLIVNFECDFEIDVDELKNYINEKNIPFGAIIIVGKTQKEGWHFKCYRIHPDFKESPKIELSL